MRARARGAGLPPKKLMVTMYGGKFTRNEIQINSRWLLQEMANFIRQPSGDDDWCYGASQGHADRVMSFGIALIASDDETVGLTQETNIALRPKTVDDKFDAAFMEPGDKGWAFADVERERIKLQKLYSRSLGNRGEDY